MIYGLVSVKFGEILSILYILRTDTLCLSFVSYFCWVSNLPEFEEGAWFFAHLNLITSAD